MHLPLNNAEVRFAWWKTRRVDKLLEIATVPAITHHLRRPRGLQHSESRDALDSLIETGRRLRRTPAGSRPRW